MQLSSVSVDVREGLDQYFTDEKQAYTDADCMRISTHLVTSDRPTWARIPRIYIILRLLDRVHAIDDFLELGINDLYLPFRNVAQLPSSLPLLSRELFLEKQNVVLTKAISLDKGRHVNFPRGERFPYEELGILGRGRYAEVGRVRSPLSGEIFARKRFPRVRGTSKEAVKTFLNELSVLKRIKHEHCVQLVGSYTDSTSFGILMFPVADCNLRDFLSHAETNDHARMILPTFFGCLANALQYIHASQIRHRDIKPENILVKERTVYLTDFGISLDWEHLSRSTTTDETARTRVYCAPEVEKQFQKRNSSTDVWSLGCVFTEMLVVTQGYRTQDLMNEFRNNSETRVYYQNLAIAHEWLKQKLLGDEPRTKMLSETIVAMLSEDPQSRPSASAVSLSLSTVRDKGSQNSYCGECCLIEAEAVEEFSDDDAWDQESTSSEGNPLATPSPALVFANNLTATSFGNYALPELLVTPPKRSAHALETSPKSPDEEEQNSRQDTSGQDSAIDASLRHTLSKTSPINAHNNKVVDPLGESSDTRTISSAGVHSQIARLDSIVPISTPSRSHPEISASSEAITSKKLFVTDELERRGKRRSPSQEKLNSIDFKPWPAYNMLGNLPYFERRNWRTPDQLLHTIKGRYDYYTRRYDYYTRGISNGLLHSPETAARIGAAKEKDIPALLHLLLGNGLEFKWRHCRAVFQEGWRESSVRIQVAQLFFAYGFAVRGRREESFGPVFESIRLDDRPLLESLLKAGANPDEKHTGTQHSERCALTYAAQLGRSNAIKVLLDYGCKDKSYETMLSAIKGNHMTSAKLLDQAGVSQCRPEGACLCLYYASRHCDLDMLHWLWASGRHQRSCLEARPRDKLGFSGENYDETALFFACRSGNSDIVKHLIDLGADAKAPNGRRSPLTIAAKKGHQTIVQILLDSGVGVNERGPNGKSALCYASTDLAKFLVDRGAKRLSSQWTDVVHVMDHTFDKGPAFWTNSTEGKRLRKPSRLRKDNHSI